MSDPTTFEELKQSIIRYVKTGVNWRIKNIDIASDQKVIDAADISGHATSVTQVSLGTEAVGASTNLAREDHAHKLAQVAAQSFLANPTGATANLQAVAVASDRVAGRDGSGNLGGILVKVAHLASIAANSVLANISGSPAQPTEVVLSQNSVLGRQTGGAGPVKVSPDMLAPIARRLTLSGTPAANAVFTMAAGETLGTWAAPNGSQQQAIPESGLYRVTGMFSASILDGTANAKLSLLVYKNGSNLQTIAGGTRFVASTAPSFEGSGLDFIRFVAGDLIDFRPSTAINGILYVRATLEKIGP